MKRLPKARRATLDEASPEQAAPCSLRQRTASTDSLYDILRIKILDSELLPGNQYLEQELALMCGVSRTPLREAAIRLQAENLVHIIPRRGIRILPLSPADMREIYDVLIGLEPMAATLLARLKPSAATLGRMEAACKRMVEAEAAKDIERWAHADDDFHLEIIEQCGNERLQTIVRNCWDQVYRARRFTLRLRQHPNQRQSVIEHRAIIAALRKGDEEAANCACREHRQRGWGEQLRVLTTFRVQQA
jgi:DNA-binding GntR family transcriptional regulator